MRWLYFLLVCVCLVGCDTTFQSKTYTYYEIIHSPGDLKVGDQVELTTNDDVTMKGTIIRLADDGVVLSDEGQGNRRIWWSDIQVIKRVKVQKTE